MRRVQSGLELKDVCEMVKHDVEVAVLLFENDPRELEHLGPQFGHNAAESTLSARSIEQRDVDHATRHWGDGVGVVEASEVMWIRMLLKSLYRGRS